MFQLEQERVLSPGLGGQLQRQLLQVERQSRHHAPAKSRVTVRETQTGEVSIEYRGRRLASTEIAPCPAPHPAPCVVCPGFYVGGPSARIGEIHTC